MLAEPADPRQPDNFWEPVPGDLGSHGPFDRMARRSSVQLWATKNRFALLSGLAIAGVGLSALMFRKKR